MKTEFLTIRLDPDALAALRRRAFVEGRSLSNLARLLITASLDIPSPDKTPRKEPSSAE